MAKGQMRSNKEKKKPKQDKNKDKKGARRPLAVRGGAGPARARNRPAVPRERSLPGQAGQPQGHAVRAALSAPAAAARQPGHQRQLVGQEAERRVRACRRMPPRSAVRPARRRCRGRAGSCADSGWPLFSGVWPCTMKRPQSTVSLSVRNGSRIQSITSSGCRSSGMVRSTPAWTKKRSPSSWQNGKASSQAGGRRSSGRWSPDSCAG